MANLEDYDLTSHPGRLLLGDPVAEAYAWIKAYAENLSGDDSDDEDDNYGCSQIITIEDLIHTGLTHLTKYIPDAEESRWGGDYLSRGGLLEGERTDPTFWKKLAVFSELEIPDDEVDQGSFFSCSC